MCRRKKDGLHFYKCTKKQVDAWYARETILGERAETTTGIRPDFHTNSPRLVLDAAMGNEFDVLINDMPAARIEPDAMKKQESCPRLN